MPTRLPVSPAPSRPLLILIAGPYRSGTGDDPALLADNLAFLERAAWPIFQLGHIPMIGEWVALPVLRTAGGTGLSDPIAAEILYPTAERLLAHCDAVLRLPGESRGADRDVAIADSLGIPVYFDVADIPAADEPANAPVLRLREVGLAGAIRRHVADRRQRTDRDDRSGRSDRRIRSGLVVVTQHQP